MASIPSAERSIELVQFSENVASRTGIDPRVVFAWGQLETGGRSIGHNWLNLRPYPGDPYSGVSSGGFEEFANVQDAINATVRRLNQPFASPIIRSAGAPPAQEIAAIASTGWDKGHYGGAGGPNLQREFTSLYGGSALAQPAHKGSAVPTGGPTSIAGGIGSAVGGAAHDVGSALSFPERAFRFLTSWRFVEVLGGFLLLLLGLYLLGRQLGLHAPAPVIVKTAAGGLGSGEFLDVPGGGSEAAYRENRAYTGRGGARRERVDSGLQPVYRARRQRAA